MAAAAKTPLKTTPKDFFLWAGAMVALYISVFSFMSLFFHSVDFAFPDPLRSYDFSSAIPSDIAFVAISFPIYLLLMLVIRADIAKEPRKRELWVRRWALTLTLFVAGITIAIDLVTLLNSFLTGDLTQPFLAKTIVVLLVATAFFLHFFADLRNHWDMHRTRALLIMVGACVAVVFAIGAGFVVTGSPWQMRLYRFDERKVSDLQAVTWQTVQYWQNEHKFPATLGDLADPIVGYRAPLDAQSGRAYEYEITGPLSFRLCATFNTETRDLNQPSGSYSSYPMPIGMDSTKNNDWYHAGGRQCFDRTIDPSRYPPSETASGSSTNAPVKDKNLVPATPAKAVR